MGAIIGLFTSEWYLVAADLTISSARRTLLFCFLAALCEGLDVQAAGVAAGGIKQQFQPTAAALGLFFSASNVGLILGALVGGRLADRIGRKAVLIVSIALFGAFSLLTSLAWDMPSLTWARALTGLGLGGAMPNLIALAADTSRADSHNTSIATTYLGMPLGGAIASLIIFVVPADAWRLVFRAGGVAPLLIVPLMIRFMPAGRHSAAPGVSPRSGDFINDLFGEGRWSRTLLLWTGFILIVLTLHLMLNWLPLLLMGRGLTKAQASLAQVGFNAGGAAAAFLAVRLLDTRWQRASLVGSLVMLPVSLILVAISPARIELLFGWVVLLGGAIMAAQVIAYGVATACYPVLARGTGVGSAVAAGRIGSLVGPLFAAALLGAGQTAVQVLFSLLPLAIACAVSVGRLGWRGLPRDTTGSTTRT